MILIVQNYVRDAINAALDKALEGFPEEAAKEREALYQWLLGYYDEHGVIPEFKLRKKE